VAGQLPVRHSLDQLAADSGLRLSATVWRPPGLGERQRILCDVGKLNDRLDSTGWRNDCLPSRPSASRPRPAHWPRNRHQHASVVPATTRFSSSLLSICASVGLITYWPSRRTDTSRGDGTEERCAGQASGRARSGDHADDIGIVAPSRARVVITTRVSVRKLSWNSGRIGRSMRRERRTSFSEAGPTMKKPPGILPAANASPVSGRSAGRNRGRARLLLLEHDWWQHRWCRRRWPKHAPVGLAGRSPVSSTSLRPPQSTFLRKHF